MKNVSTENSEKDILTSKKNVEISTKKINGQTLRNWAEGERKGQNNDTRRNQHSRKEKGNRTQTL